MTPALAIDGFRIAQGVLELQTLEALRDALPHLPRQRRGGARNLLQNSGVIAELAHKSALKSLADAALGPDCFPVRATFFDKSPDANWTVLWHQDTAIAVAERIETPGFGGWSVKDEVPHVHPPVSVLENMVALRLHLDNCGPDNGPLRVLPGTHRHGKLDATEILHWRNLISEFVCRCAAGDVLVIKPLLLHASSRARRPSHRRVIHIEYANCDLPDGLRWHEPGSKRVLLTKSHPKPNVHESPFSP